MRINRLAMDRIDLLFAAKEAARLMIKPTKIAMDMVKRIGRYLKGNPRVVNIYKWQEPPSCIEGLPSTRAVSSLAIRIPLALSSISVSIAAMKDAWE